MEAGGTRRRGTSGLPGTRRGLQRVRETWETWDVFRLEEHEVKIIGLSVDPVGSHTKWASDIEETRQAPNYPLIGDANFNVSKLYGMLPATTEGDPLARCLTTRPRRPIRKAGRHRGPTSESCPSRADRPYPGPLLPLP